MGELGRLRRGLGIDDDLEQALLVAQVDEDEAAVVAAGGHPAREPHAAARVGGPQPAAARSRQRLMAGA